MKYIIFHGSFGNPDVNWFPDLQNKLQAFGQTVLVPRFPVDSWDVLTKSGKGSDSQYQNLKNWLAVFEKEVLPKIQKDEKLCFVGHSLGPLFILHIVAKYNLKLDCAIFVAPFLEDLNVNIWQFTAVNKSFYKNDFDFEKLRSLIPISYVLYSDTDPYVGRKYVYDFANKLKSSKIMIKSAGHLNSEVNLSEFLLVFELCKTRLDLKIYQK